MDGGLSTSCYSSILPGLIYKFSAVPIRILIELFVAAVRLMSELRWESKYARIIRMGKRAGLPDVRMGSSYGPGL